MDWITDFTAVVGFFTLVLLEIVLGIDNLIFTSIATEKLPPNQRKKARFIGLSIALIARIVLLLGISYLSTLEYTLITINEKSFSGRDIILLSGGIFLIFKATLEIHERIEGSNIKKSSKSQYQSFWSVIIQVIILDLVFSIDSIITAIGMVNNVSIMVSAVIIAVIVMMLASNPLTNFINKRPTLVILSLGFLLMIGFSLIAEGFGLHIPKAYLYVAIGFSLMIEVFNQLVAKKNNI